MLTFLEILSKEGKIHTYFLAKNFARPDGKDIMSKIGEKWETQWGKINSERASCMKLSFHEIIHKNIHSRWY